MKTEMINQNSLENRSKEFSLQVSDTFAVKSLRANNYNLETALSELIDNSIDAGAKKISIDFSQKTVLA